MTLAQYGLLRKSSTCNVWCRANPQHWPPGLLQVLQDASGSRDCSHKQTLRILASLKHDGAVHRAVQDYFRDQSRWEESLKAMYQLVHLAPDVAGILLDSSLAVENQRDLESDENQPIYLCLKGAIKNKPMHCLYVEEEQVQDAIQNTEAEQLDIKDDMPPNVYEVIRYKCLLPNILNIHMLQALAKTESVDLFAKKSIQAIVNSTWNEQVLWVVLIRLAVCILEVIVLMWWGLTTKDGSMPFDRLMWSEKHSSTNSTWLTDHVGSDERDPLFWKRVKAYSGESLDPIKWNILAAVNLEQISEMAIRGFNAFSLWYAGDKCTKDLWRDGIFSYQWPLWLNATTIHLVMRTLFLTCALVFHFNDRNVMVYCQQVMLSLTYVTGVLGMFAFFKCFDSEFGLSLVAMRKTFVDPAVLHFLFMFSLLFVIVMVAWMMLDRESTLLGSLQIGWRALILSEERGIDQISDVEDGRMQTFGYIAQGLTFVMLFFFSLFLTNLLIAIVSDVYSKARQKVWVSFFQRRVILARSCVLGRPARIPRWLKPSPLCAKIVGSMGMVFATLLQVAVYYLFQNQFFKVGWAFSVVCVFVFALAIHVLKAAPFKFVNGENSWFSTNSDQKRALIVWCRKDFTENIWLGTSEDMEDMHTITCDLKDMKADLCDLKDMKADLCKVLQKFEQNS